MRRTLSLLLALCSCDKLLGLDPIPPPDAPTPLAPSSWTQVAGGVWHTCGIHVDGTLWCWGHNNYGQLGPDVTAAEVIVPQQVRSDTWLTVAAAAFHTCGIK